MMLALRNDYRWAKKRWLHPSAAFIRWSEQGLTVANCSLIVVDVWAMVKAVMTALRAAGQRHRHC